MSGKVLIIDGFEHEDERASQLSFDLSRIISEHKKVSITVKYHDLKYKVFQENFFDMVVVLIDDFHDKIVGTIQKMVLSFGPFPHSIFVSATNEELLDFAGIFTESYISQISFHDQTLEKFEELLKEEDMGLVEDDTQKIMELWHKLHGEKTKNDVSEEEIAEYAYCFEGLFLHATYLERNSRPNEAAQAYKECLKISKHYAPAIMGIERIKHMITDDEEEKESLSDLPRLNYDGEWSRTRAASIRFDELGSEDDGKGKKAGSLQFDQMEMDRDGKKPSRTRFDDQVGDGKRAGTLKFDDQVGDGKRAETIKYDEGALNQKKSNSIASEIAILDYSQHTLKNDRKKRAEHFKLCYDLFSSGQDDNKALEAIEKMSILDINEARRLNELANKWSREGKTAKSLRLFTKIHNMVGPQPKHKISLNMALACKRGQLWEKGLQFAKRADLEAPQKLEKISDMLKYFSGMMRSSKKNAETTPPTTPSKKASKRPPAKSKMRKAN